jgi:hypothetical protein
MVFSRTDAGRTSYEAMLDEVVGRKADRGTWLPMKFRPAEFVTLLNVAAAWREFAQTSMAANRCMTMYQCLRSVMICSLGNWTETHWSSRCAASLD